MFKNFKEIEQYLISKDVCKTVVVIGAHDSLSLDAIIKASKKKIIKAVLVGDKSKVESILKKYGERAECYEIIDEPDEKKAANLGMSLISDKKADIPMKGLIQSSTYLMAIAHPFKGLLPFDGLLSEATVFYYPDAERLMIATDCAINVNPSPDEKKIIISNAVKLNETLGNIKSKVAVLSAVEKINPEIPSSVHAGELSGMDWGNNIVVEGPFALDNALDREAAIHKGMESEVAGNADILLVPDLIGGNILHKSIHFFGHYEYASVMCGTTKPVIFNSRTDSQAAKYNSILLAVLQSLSDE